MGLIYSIYTSGEIQIPHSQIQIHLHAGFFLLFTTHSVPGIPCNPPHSQNLLFWTHAASIHRWMERKHKAKSNVLCLGRIVCSASGPPSGVYLPVVQSELLENPLYSHPETHNTPALRWGAGWWGGEGGGKEERRGGEEARRRGGEEERRSRNVGGRGGEGVRRRRRRGRRGERRRGVEEQDGGRMGRRGGDEE